MDCSSPLFLQQFRMPCKVASADIWGFHTDVLIVTKLALRRSPYLPVPEASFSSLCVQASSATSQGLFEDVHLGSGGCSHRCWLWYQQYAGRWGVKLVWVNTNMTSCGWVSIQVEIQAIGWLPHWFSQVEHLPHWFFTANWILFVCSLEIASFLFLFCTYLALYYIGLLLLPVNVNQLFLRKLSVTLKKIFNLTGLCFPHLLNGGGGFSLDCLETGENSLCLVGG